MKSKVYLETTIVSYLVASSTQDVVQAAHQQVTREWWARRERFDLFVSRPILAEAGRGDTTAAARRLEALAGIPVLSVGRGVTTLANTLIRTGTLPTFSHGICGTSPTRQSVARSRRYVAKPEYSLRLSARLRN